MNNRNLSQLHRLDRALGCLAGHLIGDNLGAQYEFRSARQVCTQLIDDGLEMRDGGHWGIIAGQPTDDGELMLALLRSLVEQRRYDAKSVASAYVSWLDSGPFDCGCTIGAAITSRRQWLTDEGEGRPPSGLAGSQANGALMRVAPIGVFANGDVEKAVRWAAQDAALTHPNRNCVTVNSIYAAGIACGIAGGDGRAMLATMHQVALAAENDEVLAWFDHTDIKPLEFDGPQQGWVKLAFINALHVLREEMNFRDAMTHTIARGGDTDTNAAIAGGLLGACLGIQHLPDKWVSVLEACQPDARSTSRHPRPTCYWPGEMFTLVGRWSEAGLEAAF